MNRISNFQYFLNIAHEVSKRGTCARRQVGCVLTDANHHILATAYNALPHLYSHCNEAGCGGENFNSGEGLYICQAAHAENLALIRCSDIYKIHFTYLTVSPCESCTRLLLDTGCKHIIFSEQYAHNEKTKNLWESYNRKWSHIQ